MHDAKQAATELRRAVKELGFLGAILNDFQTVSHAGGDDTFKLYDQPEYDAFWSVVQELDCPIYIHPRMPDATIEKLLYADRKGVIGSPWSFATGVSLHTLGLCCNGVFDRFPRVQVIIGHLGERIPYDIWRLDSRLERLQRPRGVTGKKTIRYYMTHNVHITTSGHFNTNSLKCALGEVGVDRIMYAIDYPCMSLVFKVNFR
jgi:2,3-dihydroxybenzoate decarboxylase